MFIVLNFQYQKIGGMELTSHPLPRSQLNYKSFNCRFSRGQYPTGHKSRQKCQGAQAICNSTHWVGTLCRLSIGGLNISQQLRKFKHSQVATKDQSNLLADEIGPHHLGQLVVWVIHLYLYIYCIPYYSIYFNLGSRVLQQQNINKN